MFKFHRKTIILSAGFIFLIFLPPISMFLGEEYIISLFCRILIYALAAVSLDLIVGYGGMVSLGHAAFVGVGAYVTGILFYHGNEAELLFKIIPGTENALIAWPCAILISSFFAFVIGSLSLRTTGMHFIMITLAFAQMLYYFSVGLEKYGGDDGLSLASRNHISGIDLSGDMTFYYVCLLLLIFFVVIISKLVNSRFGLVIRGASSNDRRIQALGVNSNHYRLVCFMIAGGGAGLAGALLANQTEYISPGYMHWTMSGELLVMVLLGGLGTVFGPIIGASIFLLVEEILSMYTEHWMLYMGPCLVIAVIFAKKGLLGILTGSKDKNG